MQFVFLLRLAAATGILRHPSLRLATLVAGWLLLTIPIYVFNGVTDVQTDDANLSHRPIASGRLKARTALGACLPLAAVGLALCLAIGPAEGCVGAGMLALGWAYSAGPCLKKAALGFAAVIGAGAALTYIAGWLARGQLTAAQLWLGLAISLWVGLCCASKDFSDVAGDALAGRRTWPVVLGARRAAVLLCALTVIATIILALTVTLTSSSTLILTALVCGSFSLIVSLLRCTDADTRTITRRPYKAFMLTQYTVNIAMALTVAA